MNALELNVYEIFKSKLGESEAKQVIEFIDSKTSQKIDSKKDVFLTKEDKIELVSKIESSKVDTIKWMVAFFITQVLMIIGLYLK